MKKPTGANWEIIVDGVSRSYRHDRETAIGSAQYLKSKHPTVDVAVRDLTTGETTVIRTAAESFEVSRNPSFGLDGLFPGPTSRGHTRPPPLEAKGGVLLPHKNNRILTGVRGLPHERVVCPTRRPRIDHTPRK